ncbi:hypothetical protein GQ55_3G152300 [Panicum hallii var. hallii]|uniref:Uncharacterized protein n=1 Tax=Panicum hallii var. hallii TaxID=1504633 RepID=A0A2T7E9Q8_9POAL|nr:hypothetical protein GQ55_3G152300 [Panicum hallii var. hallii]
MAATCTDAEVRHARAAAMRRLLPSPSEDRGRQRLRWSRGCRPHERGTERAGKRASARGRGGTRLTGSAAGTGRGRAPARLLARALGGGVRQLLTKNRRRGGGGVEGEKLQRKRRQLGWAG